MTDLSIQIPSDVNCRVFVRVRALNAQEKSAGRTQVVQVQQNALFIGPPAAQKQMTFDWIAGPDSSQESIFESVGKPMVDSVLRGYNGTIFAYGQTGSGKTFTMQGLLENGQLIQEYRGLMPRTFEYLFALMSKLKNPDLGFVCKCSFLEIYNEKITDLLNVTSSDKLQLRETFDQGVYVEGLTECVIESLDDCFKYMDIGAKNRQVRQTAKNHQSSRSHSIFTLYIQSNEKKFGMLTSKASRLHLVDLAGSERQKETQTSGASLKEASNINKALLTLGTVIRGLVDQQHGETRHIHYRDSKLTYLLKDSLGGNSKTTIIATISSASDCLAESLSTLQFAQRAKMIKNEAVVNESESVAAANELRDEVERLRVLLMASTSNERVSELEQEKQTIFELNENLSKLLDEARAIDAEKELRLKSQEQKFKQLRAQHKEAKDQLVSMGQHVNDFKIAYKREKEGLSDVIAKLQAQIKETEETKEAEILNAARKCEEIEQSKKLLEQELSAVIACLEEERGKRQESDLLVQQLKQTVEEKSKALHNTQLDLAGSRAEMKMQLQKLDQLTETYKEELLALATELQNSNKLHQQAAEKVTELEQYIERLSAEFDELAGETGRLEGELSSAKEEGEKLQKTVQEQDAQIGETSKQLQSLQDQLDSETAAFQQEMLDSRVKIAANEEQIATLTQEKEDFGSELVDLKAKHSKLDDEHFELLSTFGRLQTALTAESERSSSLTAALQKKEAELTSVMFELRTTQADLASTLDDLRATSTARDELLLSTQTLTQTVAALEADLDAWHLRCADLSNELAQTRSTVSECEKEIETLQEENGMLEEECEKMREATKISHSENVLLTEELKKAETSLEKVTNDLKEKQKQADSMEADMAELEAAHSYLMSEFQNQTAAKEGVEKDLAQERAGNEALKSQLTQKSQELSQLKEELDQAILSINNLHAQKSDLEGAIANLQTAISNLELFLKEEKEARISDWDDLTTQLKNKEERIQSVLSQLGSTDAAAVNLKLDLDTLRAQLDAERAEKAALEATYSAEKASLDASHSAEKAQLAAEVEQFQQKLSAMAGDLSSVQQLFDSSIETINKLQSETASKSTEIAALEEQKQERDEEVKKLAAAIEDKDAQLSDKDSEISMSNQSTATLLSEISQLKAQLSEMDDDRLARIGQVEQMSFERDGLKMDVEALNKQFESLQKDFDTLHAELASTIEEKSKLEADSLKKIEASADLEAAWAIERDGLQMDVALLTQQVETVQNDFEMMKAELDSTLAEKAKLEQVYSKKCEDAESQEADWNRERDSLSKQIAVLENSNMNLGVQNTEAAKQCDKALEDSAAQRAEFEAERLALREALDQVNNELEVVRSQIDSDKESLLQKAEEAFETSKRIAVEEFQIAVEELEADKADLLKQLQLIKEENSARLMLASVDTENLQSENSKLLAALQHLQNETKVVVEKADTSSAQLVQIKKGYDALQTKHTILNEQHSALKKAKEILEQQHHQQSQEFSSLKSEHAGTSTELEALRRQVHQWDSFDEKHRVTGEKLHQQLEANTQRADQFRKEKDALQQQVSTQSRRVTDLEIEKEHLLSENSKLRSQLESLGFGASEYDLPALAANPMARGQSSFGLLKSFLKAPAPAAAPLAAASTEALKVKNESESKLPQPSQTGTSMRRLGGLRRSGDASLKEKENL